MSTAVFLVISILKMSVVSGSTLICDNPTVLSIGTCGQLFKDIERAILIDEGNLLRIRRLFFHSPTASPVLLKVEYNITYGDNFTAAVSEGNIRFCSSQILLNSSAIDVEQGIITLGWTSSGIYTMFHPTVLSVMQAQTPFAFLKVIHLTFTNLRSPEANAFLWDGSYDLPTLHLNLNVSFLSCIPSRQLLESLLQDLNILLKLYGAQEGGLGIPNSAEFIGYTLPATSVMSRIIPISSDVVFENLYSATLCILYAVCICLFTVGYHHQKTLQTKVNDLIKKNADLTKGIRITTNTAILLEFVARLISCIVWSVNIENSSAIVLVVWMPQIHLLIVIVIQNSFTNLYNIVCYRKDKEKCISFGSELRTISNMCASAFALFYVLNPAIILAFAYPAQIIVIFTSVTAYLFATSIFSASIIKLYKCLTESDVNNNHKECDQQTNSSQSDKQNDKGKRKPLKWTKKIFIILIFLILWLVVVYLHFLLVLVSYLLLIGKGAVINSTPSFVISLLPSILISGVAWFAKKIALKPVSDKKITRQREINFGDDKVEHS